MELESASDKIVRKLGIICFSCNHKSAEHAASREKLRLHTDNGESEEKFQMTLGDEENHCPGHGWVEMPLPSEHYRFSKWPSASWLFMRTEYSGRFYGTA